MTQERQQRIQELEEERKQRVKARQQERKKLREQLPYASLDKGSNSSVDVWLRPGENIVEVALDLRYNVPDNHRVKTFFYLYDASVVLEFIHALVARYNAMITKMNQTAASIKIAEAEKLGERAEPLKPG